jgi:hypothetical protein
MDVWPDVQYPGRVASVRLFLDPIDTMPDVDYY